MRTALALLLFLSSLATAQTSQVNYDIVYVRQERFGDQTFTWWPEVFHPARLDVGADLMLLHADGSEEVLVDGGIGGVKLPSKAVERDWTARGHQGGCLLGRSHRSYNANPNSLRDKG